MRTLYASYLLTLVPPSFSIPTPGAVHGVRHRDLHEPRAVRWQAGAGGGGQRHDDRCVRVFACVCMCVCVYVHSHVFACFAGVK
jgi:hypothetical protein